MIHTFYTEGGNNEKKGSLLCANCLLNVESGAGGNRTLVRSKHLRAFYMLSRLFVFSSNGKVRQHTRTVTLALWSSLLARVL